MADSSGAGRHARMEGSGRGDAVTENPVALVQAARAGDRLAADALISAHLPLLYRVVGRALDGHADVDDVVQETVLRAHRDLPALRAPESFRSWLVAIAMHQVSGRLRAWQVERERTAALTDAEQIADPGAEFAGVTALRLELSAQRRQVAEAMRWLDPDDQQLAALWWREVLGELDRAEVVAALGVNAAHARVRIQRMRRQLELCRHLVVALEARPRCPRLDEVLAGWDGVPSPRWRKRLARHLRDCDVCGATGPDLLPLERLVAGAAAVPLPVAVGAAVGGATAGAGSAVGGATAGAGSAVGWLGQAVGVKVAAAVLVTATVSGGVYLARPEPRRGAAPPATPVRSFPALAASPSLPDAPADPTPSRTASPRPARLVALGPAVLRPVARPGAVVALNGDRMVAASGVPAVEVTVIPGVADPDCLSMRSADGRYVRHASFRILLNTDENRDLFRRDATFCPRPGPQPGTVRLVSLNYPDRMVHLRGNELWLDPEQTDQAYVADSAFTIADR
ncbi:sigma-70 family RNA polymerase sigma factor [Paractinoplanes abujensis]|uniref:RNA polymerase sigma factor (Sigma-70 family) n=1 Tax=Paractinoplanes abujensis TaxID=882441 RepID=A0A7W7G0H9_9ACTN|nr:sigma-70 family RNA polymerase sigma factor [Actinoplanes abujensis]MBB4693098.1 RNA polymerase sigma factor (sigma-70 family) [Actinoplanes abujensis]